MQFEGQTLKLPKRKVQTNNGQQNATLKDKDRAHEPH